MIKCKIQSAQYENVFLEAEDKDGDFIEFTICDAFNNSKIIVETAELEAMLGIIADRKPTFWQKVIAYISMRTIASKPVKAWKNPEIKVEVEIPRG